MTTETFEPNSRYAKFVSAMQECDRVEFEGIAMGSVFDAIDLLKQRKLDDIVDVVIEVTIEQQRDHAKRSAFTRKSLLDLLDRQTYDK